ncbi:MAG TPA: putative collagen-binding domain-containing protein, partial [Thermoanaerobaculia bacterium]
GRFAARVPFAEMAPADGLVLGGNAWALAAPGSAYVFFLYGGGTVRVDLRAASGPLQAEWYDPRDGSSHLLPVVVVGEGVESFTAPSQEDWVLYLHR